MALTPWGKRREAERDAQLVAVVKEAMGEQVTKALANIPSSVRAIPGTAIVDTTGLAPTTDGSYPLLPRDPRVFGGPFGPGVPLPSAAIDPNSDLGRPDPRLSQYDPTRNLNLEDRATPWALLRALADQNDVVRRCIEIGKANVTGLAWHFTLADDVIQQIMAETGEINQARAAASARTKFAAEIDRLTQFWIYPDRRNGYSWSEWWNLFLEEHWVLDAVPIWPHPNLGGGLHSLEILDGTTIKPLLDHRGARPEPPNPAFQQILWGFPRGEFTESNPDGVDAEFRATDLYYAVRNRRTFSPYGFSAVEQAIPAATLWLERQAWLKAEYTAGSMPASVLELTENSAAETWSPDHRKIYEDALNDELSGNTSNRNRLKLLFPGMKLAQMPAIDEKYKPEYDEFLIKQIGSKFGVAPTQLGIIPRTGIGGRGQQEGEQDQSETVTQAPLLRWIEDVVNEISQRYLGMPSELTLKIDDGGTNRHQAEQATVNKSDVSTGIRTINDIRADLGLPLFDMPEADQPMVVVPTGPIFLKGTLDAQLNPPEPPPVVVAGAPHPGVPPAAQDGAQPLDGAPKPEPKPGEPAPQPSSAEQQQAEAKKFLAYATRRQGRAWREFSFDTVPAPVASRLNSAGASGDLELVKALVADVGKGQARSEDRPGYPAEQRILNAYAPLLRRAITQLVDPAEVARLVYQSVTVLMKRDRGLAEYVLRLLAQAQVDAGAVRDLLTKLWAAAYVSGRAGAAKQTAQATGTPTSDDTDQAALGVDWGEWKAGDRFAAVLTEGTGLQGLLDAADITIHGIVGTTLEQVANSLADSLTAGLPVDAAARALGDVVDNPDRAWLIADTEMCRAVSVATLDSYTANGIAGKSWLTIDSPCPYCQAASDEGPVPLGQSFVQVGVPAPPGHPRCRCTLVPELNLPTTEGPLR